MKTADSSRVLLAAVAMSAIASMPIAAADTSTSPPDTGMVLRGGDEGTVFKNLTVEGEDLVRIEFDRPTLELDVDPRQAPGLVWGDVGEIVERGQMDLVSPLLTRVAIQRTPFRPRPWFDHFASGAVARFRPEVEGVDGWSLRVADSRGQSVVTFEGKGKPPKEIAWNGLASDGTPAPPGLVYSHAFEAVDRAGNKRNFLGEGFELPPYRVETAESLMLLFPAAVLAEAAPPASSTANGVSPILLEAATWLNQRGRPDRPITIEVTARSYDQANAVGRSVIDKLTPILVGDPSRVQSVTDVRPDAPSGGTVTITAALWKTR